MHYILYLYKFTYSTNRNVPNMPSDTQTHATHTHFAKSLHKITCVHVSVSKSECGVYQWLDKEQ